MRVTVLILGVVLLVLLAALALRAWLRDRSGAGGAGKKATAGAAWRPEVELEQLSERRPDYEALRLKIVLHDSRGREVETPDVRFQLDGTALEYRVAGGNYYDRHPYYRIEGESGLVVKSSSTYHLAVSSAGGPFVPFATLPPLAPFSTETFSLPLKSPRDRDLVLTWKNLALPAELLIYKSHQSKTEQGDVYIEGGPYSDENLKARIQPGRGPDAAGRYVIPTRFLSAVPPSKVTAVTVEITSRSSGEFLFPVLEDSQVTTVRKIVLRTEIEDP